MHSLHCHDIFCINFQNSPITITLSPLSLLFPMTFQRTNPTGRKSSSDPFSPHFFTARNLSTRHFPLRRWIALDSTSHDQSQRFFHRATPRHDPILVFIFNSWKTVLQFKQSLCTWVSFKSLISSKVMFWSWLGSNFCNAKCSIQKKKSTRMIGSSDLVKGLYYTADYWTRTWTCFRVQLKHLLI